MVCSVSSGGSMELTVCKGTTELEYKLSRNRKDGVLLPQCPPLARGVVSAPLPDKSVVVAIGAFPDRYPSSFPARSKWHRSALQERAAREHSSPAHTRE